MRRQATTACLLAAALLCGCETMPVPAARTQASESIVKEAFGTLPDGRAAHLYRLTNVHGTTASITDYGATLVSVNVRDARGQTRDVVLGFDSVEGYAGPTNPYFGATCGRVANRIADGRFELDGTTYQLAVNNGPNHLHGGIEGFNAKLWNAEMLDTADGPAVRFTLRSPDGDEGYPGNLDVTTTYTLTADNELRIEMTATTDAPTPVNFANHSYWNLGGHESGDVLSTILQLHASRFTPTDDTLIPTGELAIVSDTAYDFTTPKAIGLDIAYFQSGKLKESSGGGYDINFVVDGRDKGLRPVAKAVHPESGIVMELLADQPGVQLYTANWISNLQGKGSAVYNAHAGFCLETQNFPDAIHHRNFPDSVLRPGETYRHVMVHRFSTR